MKYFFDCKTQEDAKAKYRKLAKELHPDMGGNTEAMAELAKQYNDFVEEGNNGSKYNDYLGQRFEKAYEKAWESQERKWQEAAQRNSFKGFAFNKINPGYQYRPPGSTNDAYFNVERQKLCKEIDEYRLLIASYRIKCHQMSDELQCLEDENEALKKEIDELKKKHEYCMEINRLLNKENQKLRNQSLWTKIKTAFASLKGSNVC